MEPLYFDWRSLPNKEAAFGQFLSSYPRYLDTTVTDSVRDQEYSHLDDRGQVCLDYTGVGLFSNLQQCSGSAASSVGLSYISANLATHAMYSEDATTESFFRDRILRYMNIDEKDYHIVFTANSFSAFKLLGESYPFHEAQNLLLGYDHQCETLDGISQCARAKTATVMPVNLSWPGLKFDAEDLKKKLQGKRKGTHPKMGNAKGLFAYPFISRVTGARNSLQWILEAQQNGWHVLLDVTSVGAKGMDTLGLSVFLPDFIICSFYKVFGCDPTGFGCLVIKKSVLRTLGDSSRARAIGMVNIVTKQATSTSPTDSPVSACLASGSNSQSSREGSFDGRRESTPTHSPSSLAGSPSEKLALNDSGFREWGHEVEAMAQMNAYRQDQPVGNGMRDSTGKAPEPSRRSNLDDPSCSWQQLFSVSSTASLGLQRKPIQHDNTRFSQVDEEDTVPGICSVVRTNEGRSDESCCRMKALAVMSHGPDFSNEQPDDFGVVSSTARVSSFHKDVPHHGDVVGAGGGGYGAQVQVGSMKATSSTWPIKSENPESLFNGENPESLFNGENPESLFNGEHGSVKSKNDKQVSKRKNVKGLFYGECTSLKTTNSKVSKGLFYGPNTSLTGSSPNPVQRIVNHYPATDSRPAEDSSVFNAKHGRLSCSSASQSVLPVSAPCSPSSRFVGDKNIGFDDIQGKHMKSAVIDQGIDCADVVGKDMESVVICRGLDHADKVGITRIAFRLRALMNWLISSLSRLRHPQLEKPHLVVIYSPVSQGDRGATIAFNLSDSAGIFFDASRVQRLADRNNISLRTGIIEGSFVIEQQDRVAETENEIPKGCVDLAAHKWRAKGEMMQTMQLPVLYAALGFLSNFSDVYRLWVFVSQFLDPDFVKQDLWHYQALNQETIEI